MKIPTELIEEFEKETIGLSHGIVSLSLHLRDGKPRYVISKEKSILLDELVKDMGELDKENCRTVGIKKKATERR